MADLDRTWRARPRRRPTAVAGLVLVLAAAAAACRGQTDRTPRPPGGASEAPDLAGAWRAVLASPGGELPFTLRIEPEGAHPPAFALNAEEEAPFSSLERREGAIVLRIDGYDSEIRAVLEPGGSTLRGAWTKTVPDGSVRLPFTAWRGQSARFVTPPGEGEAVCRAPAAIGGVWEIRFRDEKGEEPGRGEFRQEGTRVTGTILTPTGDHRYLEGDYAAGVLRLSCFDGGHAFLYVGRALDDGTLAGDFWSSARHVASWTARPGGAPDSLPDPYAQVEVTHPERRLRFSFPDLAGHLISDTDARFRGRVVLVSIFGSWCPNCNDEAPLLAAWHRRWREAGLEVVGLAFEFTGDAERDRTYVRKYALRHGIDFPLLLAGVSDKEKAGEVLPDLSRIAAYPTTILIGRDGKVRRVHSGFAGPATGGHHARLVTELESAIGALLEEPVPAPPG